MNVVYECDYKCMYKIEKEKINKKRVAPANKTKISRKGGGGWMYLSSNQPSSDCTRKGRRVKGALRRSVTQALLTCSMFGEDTITSS
jgi:hypothetical protein